MYYIPDPYSTPKHKIGLAVSLYSHLVRLTKLMNKIVARADFDDWIYNCFGLYRDCSLSVALTDFVTTMKFLPAIYVEEGNMS